MKTARVVLILAALCVCPAAQAASVISVPDSNSRTLTTTTAHGTATTEITRNGNSVTARTTFRPAKQGYQPMGSGSYAPMGSGSYAPMGKGGYNPMGR